LRFNAGCLVQIEGLTVGEVVVAEVVAAEEGSLSAL